MTKLACLLLISSSLCVLGCQESPAVVNDVSEVTSPIDHTRSDRPSNERMEGPWQSQEEDSEENSGKSSNRLVVRTPVSTSQLAEYCQLANLEVLEIYRADFSPGRLEAISHLQRLQRLRLEDLPIDDAAWQGCREMPAMRILNAPAMKISDVGIKRMVECMPNLELLRVGSDAISDTGVAHLRDLKSLRFLHLVNIPITDAGLGNFYDLHDLESLYIDGGKETESGIRVLLEKNPKLHFHRNQMHIASDPNDDGH